MTDVRHLHIVLMCAERAWAQANALKQEAEAEGDGQPQPAKRRRGIRRLRKAASWAGQLARLSAVVCDARGALEAEAYAAWMTGTALMEGETQWEAARNQFSRARALFLKLAELGDPESTPLWGGMRDELDTALRLCDHELRKKAGGAADAGAVADLARLGSDGTWGSFTGPTGADTAGGLLQSKLASLAAEAQVAQAAATSSFEWRGLKCSLPLEKLRVPLHNAKELAATLGSAMDTDDSTPEDALPQHDKLINLYSEARGVARSTVKMAAAGASGPAAEANVDVEELGRLETALTGAILEASLARGEVAAAAAAARFNAALSRQAAGKPARAGGKDGRPAKPEDLVRLYTTLSQHAHELEEHSSNVGGRAGEALASVAATRSAAYAAWRSYYAAHAALAAGDERLAEAAGLFSRAKQRAAEAEEAIEELPKSEAACWALLPGLQGLQQSATGYMLVAAAEAAATGAAGAANVTSAMEGLGLAKGQQATTAQLLDALDSWESFGGSGPTAKGARVYAGPYSLAPIAPRPIMVDTAADEIDYPDVSHRCTKRQVQTQSTFSRIWRGWGS